MPIETPPTLVIPTALLDIARKVAADPKPQHVADLKAALAAYDAAAKASPKP